MQGEALSFAGAALVVDAAGQVRAAHPGFDPPIVVEHAVGRPIHEVLGLCPDGREVAALQLWLASGDRVPVELWRMSLADPPRVLPPCAGRPAIALDYAPVIVDDEVQAVTVLIRAARERSRTTRTRVAVTPEPTLPDHARSTFARSASDLLSQAETALTRIDADREARSALHRLFRAIHTLKGEAQALGLGEVLGLAHGLEDVLVALRAADVAIGGDDVDRLRDGVARLRGAVAAAVGDEIEHADAMSVFHEQARPLLTRMQRCLEHWAERPRVRRYGEELRRITAMVVDQADRARLRVLSARARALAAAIDGCLTSPRFPRSVLAQIDHQLDELELCLGLYQQLHLEIAASDSAGEVLAFLRTWRPRGPGELGALAEPLAAAGILVIGRVLGQPQDARAAMIPGALADVPAMFEPAAPERAAPGEALEALRSAVSLCSTLEGDPESRDLARRLRAELGRVESALTRVSLDELEPRLTQAAHGLAAELGKQVQIEADMLGVRVLPGVRRGLGEALLHAVRNAVDHGVEAPAARIASGKSATARIEIRSETQGDVLVIEIRDDGGGVDFDRVRRRAVDHGLASADEAAGATPEQLLELLFHPGFSTAATVTHVSGRGVGLDAVRAAVGELGGQVSIATAPGRGTSVRLEVPGSEQT